MELKNQLTEHSDHDFFEGREKCLEVRFKLRNEENSLLAATTGYYGTKTLSL